VIGLWLNLPRAETRQARGFLHAIVAVLGSGKMSKEWVSAFSDNAAESEANWNRHQFSRAGGANGSPKPPWDGAHQG
jgi:hypothetical protein